MDYLQQPIYGVFKLNFVFIIIVIIFMWLHVEHLLVRLVYESPCVCVDDDENQTNDNKNAL